MSLGSATIRVRADDKPLKAQLVKIRTDLVREFVNARKKAMHEAGKLKLPVLKPAEASMQGAQAGKKFANSFGGAMQAILGPRFNEVLSVFGGGGAAAFTGPMLAGIAAISVAIIGMISAWKLARRAIADFVKHERLLNRITSVIKVTKQAAGFTAYEIRNMTREMAKFGVIAESQLLRAATILSTFINIAGIQFEKALQATADISRVMGVDARTAALQLGKALSQPSTGMATLREAGVLFTRQQTEMIKEMEKAGRVVDAQNLLFEILAENGIGGNTKATENLADQWDRMVNLSEQIVLRLGELAGQAVESSDALQILNRTLLETLEIMEKDSPFKTLQTDMAGLALRHYLRDFEALGIILGALNGYLSDTGVAFKKFNAVAATATTDLNQKLIAQADIIEKMENDLATKIGRIHIKRVERQKRLEDERTADAVLGIKEQEKEIKKLQEARSKAEATDHTKKAISDQEDAIKATDKATDAIADQIRAIRKRNIETASTATVTAEGLFMHKVKESDKAVNEARKNEKEAKIEALELEKKKIKAQKEAFRETMGDLKEQAQAEIDIHKDKLAKKLEMEQSNLQQLKEMRRLFIQEQKEEREIGRDQEKLDDQRKEALSLIVPAVNRLQTLLAQQLAKGADEQVIQNIANSLEAARKMIEGNQFYGSKFDELKASIERTQESNEVLKAVKDSSKQNKQNTESTNTILRNINRSVKNIGFNVFQ